MKKIISILRNGLLKNIVIGIFFLVLIAEGYMLYKRMYLTRIYTRPTLIPILLLVYINQLISRNHILLVASIICACIADYLTIQYVVFQQWSGLGMYSLSFTLLAIYFFRISYFSFRSSFVSLLVALVGLVAYIAGLEILSKAHNQVIPNKPLIYFYATTVALLTYSVLNAFLNNKTLNLKFAVAAVVLLILGNISFESSLYVFHRRSTLIDVFTATCYGTFLFLMVSGSIKLQDKINGADYFAKI